MKFNKEQFEQQSRGRTCNTTVTPLQGCNGKKKIMMERKLKKTEDLGITFNEKLDSDDNIKKKNRIRESSNENFPREIQKAEKENVQCVYKKEN